MEKPRTAVGIAWHVSHLVPHACPKVASRWGQGEGPIPLERAGVDFGPTVRPQIKCFCTNPYQRRPGMNGYNCTSLSSWTSVAFCPLRQACVKPARDLWPPDDRPCAVWEKPCASCAFTWVARHPGPSGTASGTRKGLEGWVGGKEGGQNGKRVQVGDRPGSTARMDTAQR